MGSAAIGAGAPDWVVELAGVSDRVAGELASTGDVGGVKVQADGGDLVVSLGWHRGEPDEVARLVAYMVASMWPPWLAEWGVGLTISAPSWVRRATCAEVVALAAEH